jgi:hypothetical protein
MSAFGTKWTSPSHSAMSVFEGKANIEISGRDVSKVRKGEIVLAIRTNKAPGEFNLRQARPFPVEAATKTATYRGRRSITGSLLPSVGTIILND